MKFKTPLLTTILLALSLACTGPATADRSLELCYAKGFKVEDLGGCRLVTVRAAWNENGAAFRYLLVPQGGTIPKEHPPAQIIRVPVKRVVSLSTTHLAYMDAAGMVGRLVGLASCEHVNTPSVRRRIAAGELKAVGDFAGASVETLLELAPDVILTSASGTVYDVHPKLIEAGLPTLLVIDHLESHPLGRLEWIKLLALLFDTQSHADGLFKETVARYQALARKTDKLKYRPKVITGAPFQGQWWVARGDSFVARYLADAGAEYYWSGVSGGGSAPMDVEAVYEQALSADFWLNTGAWKTMAEAETADPRFAVIPAVKRHRLYNNNKRLNAHGGNDYWESGILRPDVVLADLIAILHPELLPDHELVYYRRIGQ